MSDLQRAEKRAIVLANDQNADEAASKLFVCYHSVGKMDSAAIYARKVIEIGKQRDDSEIRIEGYIKLAVAQMDTPNLDSVHYYLNLILSETKNSEETHMTHARASAYMFFGAMY